MNRQPIVVATHLSSPARISNRSPGAVRVAILLLTSFLSSVNAGIAAELSDEVFGAADDGLGPLGGGAGYKRLVVKYDYLVKTEQELIDSLKKAKPGQVVYVDDNAELDFSPWVVVEDLVMAISAKVTLASGRGKNGSKGALLCSDAFKTRPLFQVDGNDVRITGLRIRGPDPKIRNQPLNRWAREKGRIRYYKFPTSDGIQAAGLNLEVDNCELWGWSHGAIYLMKGATNAHIHHNYIHHNQRSHLGYGVVLDQSNALIESNIFDWNRHSIAATGRPGTSYEACNNLVGEHANSHLFDMHGGRDRKDGTDIAGDWIKVHHNTFKAATKRALVIRGTPREGVEVHHNWFAGAEVRSAVSPRSAAFLNIYNNQFGPERKLIE